MYRKPTSIIYMIFNYEILEDISNETYKYVDQYMEQNHVVEKELRDGIERNQTNTDRLI